MENKDLTGRIIGAAITVHKALGPGFLEEVYEEAMAVEFDFLGIKYERQKVISISYRNRKLKDHRLDFLVENLIMVEIKAVAELEARFFAISRSYLKAGNLQDDLMLNFASMPLTIKRIGREEPARKNINHHLSLPIARFPNTLFLNAMKTNCHHVDCAIFHKKFSPLSFPAFLIS